MEGKVGSPLFIYHRGDYLTEPVYQEPSKEATINFTFSEVTSLLGRGENPHCKRCEREIKRGEPYRRNKGYDKRMVRWNQCYCLDCIAWFMSRYSFLKIPEPTPEEIKRATELLQEYANLGKSIGV